jgi:hypothetical protein
VIATVAKETLARAKDISDLGELMSRFVTRPGFANLEFENLTV